MSSSLRKESSYKVKSNVFETSHYYFSPDLKHATSYSWWSMLVEYNGVLVRNRCGYSPQTSKHQDMLDRHMELAGMKEDFVVYTRANIGSRSDWKAYVLKEYGDALVKSEHARIKRYDLVSPILDTMREIESLKIGIKFLKREMKAAVVDAEKRRASRLEFDRWKRQVRKEREEQEKIKVASRPILTLVK